MKMYVYHSKEMQFGHEQVARISLRTIHEEFDAVAIIEGDEAASEDALEDAFELTNHIDRPWWENEGVRLCKESRSTSVGDLVVIERGEREEFWRCERVGWKRLVFLPF